MQAGCTSNDSPCAPSGPLFSHLLPSSTQVRTSTNALRSLSRSLSSSSRPDSPCSSDALACSRVCVQVSVWERQAQAQVHIRSRTAKVWAQC
jgi:hypothetical protein